MSWQTGEIIIFDKWFLSFFLDDKLLTENYLYR